MATYTIEQLKTLRDNALTELLSLTDGTKRKPSYSAGDGSVDWDRHAKDLRDRIDWCSQQIEYLEGPGQSVVESEAWVV